MAQDNYPEEKDDIMSQIQQRQEKTHAQDKTHFFYNNNYHFDGKSR